MGFTNWWWQFVAPKIAAGNSQYSLSPNPAEGVRHQSPQNLLSWQPWQMNERNAQRRRRRRHTHHHHHHHRRRHHSYRRCHDHHQNYVVVSNIVGETKGHTKSFVLLKTFKLLEATLTALHASIWRHHGNSHCQANLFIVLKQLKHSFIFYFAFVFSTYSHQCLCLLFIYYY